MRNVDELLPLLTLEEKVALVAGYKFMRTNPVPRLDIPSIKMSDGPHGLRVQVDGGDNGVTNSLPATCFPTASCSANTWRPSFLKEMGKAMAEEAKYYNIDIILGPGVNIKRNPLCGRNFEYFSEDPFLAGKLGASEVNGIQEENIGVSLKHYAFNSSENYRFMSDSIVDMRAMREIYLRQFEYIVKSSKPETLMAAYNKVNGVHCSENGWILNEVLRKEWGFEGLVMSDWGTTHDRIEGIRTGLDLEMPGDNEICRKWLFDAINDGSLDIKDLDLAVRNVLNLVYKRAQNKQKLDNVDWEKHHELAKQIALEGAVLLKNDGELPLKENEKYLVVGELFEKARYQGAGSSMICPYKLSSSKDAFDKNNISYEYLQGYKVSEFVPNEELINEAVEASKNYDKVILFIGLTDWYECEGVDRKDMSIPNNQLALIDALVKENKKLVIVLFGGSVMELPFYDNVNAILDMFLSGQNSGEATYELLFGKKNPSGRLVETWPIKYEDVPFYNEYSKNAQEVYKESIYVGYRYYLTANKEVRFPFGYGLSYTSFEYNNIQVEQNEKELVAKVSVTNIGEVSGDEVVQIYVSAPKNNAHKPIRELKGFTKVHLKAKETKEVSVILDKEDLKYWDINENRFVLEDGRYDVQVGKNSRDIVLNKEVTIKGEKLPKTAQRTYESLDFDNFTNDEYEKVWNIKIPELPSQKPITLESRLSDLKSTFFGKILYSTLQSVAKKETKKARRLPEGSERENKIKGAEFLKIILDANSIISLSMSSSGAFPYPLALGFKDIANGRLFRGIKNCLSKVRAPKLPIEMGDK